MRPAITIIADDLTGACDTGAVFAQAGWRTLVLLAPESSPVAASGDIDVLVYTTESRYLPVEQASAAVAHIAGRVIATSQSQSSPLQSPSFAASAISGDADEDNRLKPRAPESPVSLLQSSSFAASAISGHADEDNRLKPRPPESPISTLQSQLGVWVYKKIDSTLRGHPCEELAALMDALKIKQALVAPAFPAQGRTTLNAQLIVDGQPHSAATLVDDVPSGDLRLVFRNEHYAMQTVGLDVVRAGVRTVAEWMCAQPGILMADAQTDDDLITLASAAQVAGIRLLCGSAGLARALAQVIGARRVAQQSANVIARPVSPFLVMAGSRNPATLKQIETARGSGVAVINLPAEFGQPDKPYSAALDHVSAQVKAVIAAGRDVIVTTAALELSPLGKDVIAHRLGEIAAQVLTGVRPGTLVLTGGDIAASVCAALGAHGITLLGELQPGIAFGSLSDGAYDGLRVVTKAGGFGRAESLLEIIRGMGD
ncbi:MAG TPA: four-carbon acid sugar kinase family protein [Anaerolineae bacterium]|jgi:uncharacterized protein YgbK (DUF1537 family)